MTFHLEDAEDLTPRLQRFGKEKNTLLLPGIELRFLDVAVHYTDCTI